MIANRVGQQLGNYRLLRLLGRGGFAEVYLGEHLYLKSQAALKVLRTSLEDEDVARFLAEGQTLARLTHPQIVRVHDFAVEQGTPFLVMDYAPRGTLRQRHPRGSCLSLETVVTYVKQAAAALQYAHNRNVIHRDVKPENMLLGAHRELLLSDFGLALLFPSAELLSTQEMAGTIPYMAPEQLRGKPCFASDQYALGIVVYEWLCGVRPFEGSYWQLVNQHALVLPPPLREKDPSLPEAVENVLLKALAKDSEQRFVSVQLFAQALERASQVRAGGLRSDLEVTGSLVAFSPVPVVTNKKVFLSASHADEPFVARLQADLQRRGIAVCNASPGSTPNTPNQEDALRQMIRAVDVVLLVVSPHASSSHAVKEHLRIAGMYQRRLVFVWAAGNDLAAVLPDAWGKTAPLDLIDARQVRYELALDELVVCLAEETTGSSPVESTLVELAGEPRNPYKGLRAFTKDDTEDFFGRDTLIQELVGRLRGVLTSEQPGVPSGRLLSIIGPSGSGKSSVVMAGLLPRLQRGALPRSEEWVYLKPMVPGTHPLEALVLTLAPHFPNRSLKAIYEDLEDDVARGLHLLATQLVKEPQQKVVLLVDQFEELFTLTASEDERRHFIDLLLTAMTEPHGSVIVLLTLRADFYDRPLSYPALGLLIQHHQSVVLPMELHDLRAVIKQPAALLDVQVTFEGNLVGDLLFEVQGQIGALPLLQFTLDQLFQRREHHVLTLRAYREIGGVKGALAKQAEITYAALPSEEHCKLARALFLRLIDPGVTEQETTRRRATLSELSLTNAIQTHLLRETMDAFIAARLLTANEVAGTIAIEVSHEALIREWTRLSDWLREAREDIRLQQTISEDVAEWQRRGKPKDRLYHGSQLAEATMWVKRNVPSRDEEDFIQASTTRERIVRYQLRLLVGITSMVLVGMLVVALVLQGSLLAAQGSLLKTQRDLLASLPVSVTNLNDHGPGSLRDAIARASDGEAITFAKNLKGTITLTSGELNITRKNVVISGPSASILSISGGTTSRVFNINEGTVTISNVTIKNSHALRNGESFTLSSSGSGGAIFNHFGSLVLVNSIILDNTADTNGGGIFNLGTLSLINSTVSGNTARVDNAGNGGNGGGIFNFGTLNLINSTVSGNTSHKSGGGIYNEDSGVLTLTNSTISGNIAASDGGGIFGVGQSGSGQFSLTFCTVYDNTAKAGGGIVSTQNTTVNTMASSIVAHNHADKSPDIMGALVLSYPNLIENTAGATFVSTDPHFVRPITGTSPNVSPLQNNGGPTQTNALLPGSPAIDQIVPTITRYDTICGRFSLISTDQRGVKRPQGKGCDIGAYEYEPPH
jgi:serine/threonine protein kinase